MTARLVNADTVREQDCLRELVWAYPRERRQALQIVKPEDFQQYKHRAVLEVIRTLDAVGDVDFPAVVDELDREGELEHVGGVSYVTQLLGKVPIAVAPVRVATRLAEEGRRRRLVAEAQGLATRLAESNGDMAQVLHAGVDRLLAEGRGDAEGLVLVADVGDELAEFTANGPRVGYECGWADVDRLYRPDLGQLTVLTGVPSHGKSTWLDAYLSRLAHRHSWRFVFFSPERAGGKRGIAKHVARLASVVSGVAWHDMDSDRQAEASKWVADHFLWIDDTNLATVEGVLAATRLAADTKPVQGLIVDPWNWIEPNKPRDMTMTQYIGHALNGLSRFAIRHELHVWVVAHPTKLRQHEAGDKAGTYHVPRPYDISESSNWFNKPWWCLTVWRDHLAVAHGQPGANVNRDPLLVDVHVQKVREDDQGQVGVATLRFDPRTRRYACLAREAV